jgi:hypothetical protein
MGRPRGEATDAGPARVRSALSAVCTSEVNTDAASAGTSCRTVAMNMVNRSRVEAGETPMF